MQEFFFVYEFMCEFVKEFFTNSCTNLCTKFVRFAQKIGYVTNGLYCRSRPRPSGLYCIVYVNSADRQSGTSLPMPNSSKFKRLVCPKFMLFVKLFLTDKVFLAISCLIVLLYKEQFQVRI